MIALQVLVHPLATTLSPEATFTVAAESGGGIEQIRAVDPHHARLDLRRDVEREIDALAPHTRRETVLRVVGKSHRFGRSAEGHRHEHWSEDLDLRDGG
jgi:hypothetical protein